MRFEIEIPLKHKQIRPNLLKKLPGKRLQSGAIEESFRENLLIKSRNQNIYEKFKLNRNLQTIPFEMMYNMSMLRHRFSNERLGGGGGGGEGLNHLPLSVCKSVHLIIGVIVVSRSSRPGINDYWFGKRFKRIERKSLIAQCQRSEDVDYNAKW